MNYVIESMKFPIDNLLGILIYAIIIMIVSGLVVSLCLRFIPNSLPYEWKRSLIGSAVTLSLLSWILIIMQ